MGRVKKPIELKIAQGNKALNLEERIKSDPLSSQMPDTLIDDSARLKWLEMYKRMMRLNMLSETDGEILVMFCNCWSELLRLEQYAKNCDVVIDDERHSLKKNPVFSMLKEHREMCKSLLIQLGCTPTTRNHVMKNACVSSAPAISSSDELFEFLDDSEQKAILDREKLTRYIS